jgi:hypothetical protein
LGGGGGMNKIYTSVLNYPNPVRTEFNLFYSRTDHYNLFQPIKKPVRTLSIFTSMAFVKDANRISFKNRLKGHVNWRKVRTIIL